MEIERDLGGGLFLRRGCVADVPALAEFISRGFAPEGFERFVPLGAYVEDLASGRHPTVKAEDFLLVEDREHEGRIVSALVLISQAWTLDGVTFGVGRPEIVVTDKAYRRRGLVRALFEATHALSAEYGHAVQGITGILNFYRQFGYEYAVDMGGWRGVPFGLVPSLRADEPELYTVRPAELSDVPQIMRLYERQCADYLVYPPRDERWTRWIFFEQTRGSSDRLLAWMIVDAAGTPVGYLGTYSMVEDPHLTVAEIAVEAGVSLRAALPGVMRAIKAFALTLRTFRDEEPTRLLFILGREHPAYAAGPEYMVQSRPPYGWYVRVPDLPGFLQMLAPVFARRLAGSIMAGYSGTVSLCFYKDGVQMRFEQGILREVTRWEKPDADTATACFPDLSFLQVLFGRNAFSEMHAIMPDVYCPPSQLPLVEALFPKRLSCVRGMP